MLGNVADILTIDQDLSRQGIIKAQQQPADGRFSRTRWSDDGRSGAGGYRKTNVMEDGAFGFITETDIAKFNDTAFVPQGSGILSIGNFNLFIDQ